MNIQNSLIQLEFELKRRNYSPCTISNYSDCLKSFFNNSTKNIKNLTTENSQNNFIKSIIFHVEELQKLKLSARTINLHINAIKTFGKLVLKYYISKEEIPRLKEPKSLPDPLSKEEIKRIFENEKNEKHLLLLQLTYSAGLRLS
jgi:integrase/recombinase XerD